MSNNPNDSPATLALAALADETSCLDTWIPPDWAEVTPRDPVMYAPSGGGECFAVRRVCLEIDVWSLEGLEGQLQMLLDDVSEMRRRSERRAVAEENAKKAGAA